MTVPSLTMKQTVSLATILAAITLASPAAASDTHGCWTRFEKARVQVIATWNVTCRDAVPFIHNALEDGAWCVLVATNRRCGFTYRRYGCRFALRYVPDDVVMSAHCTRGSTRRIGVNISWLFALTGKPYTG